MPWTCPACAASIEHVENTPRPGVIYRCNACRLELVLDSTTGTLIPAPVSDPSS